MSVRSWGTSVSMNLEGFFFYLADILKGVYRLIEIWPMGNWGQTQNFNLKQWPDVRQIYVIGQSYDKILCVGCVAIVSAWTKCSYILT